MLGKTFKGLTDAMLAWQTEQLLSSRRTASRLRRGRAAGARRRDRVRRRPDVPRYPAGVALRFARVMGYRPDKRAAEADTIDTVRAIHAGAQTAGS